MTEPRILKGFRDSLPLDEIERENMITTIKRVFSSFGYAPIDTPCLEYEDVLLSKSAGETEKQIYAFNDNGGRWVALRFDLTVPFARFVALHAHKEIEIPFKRYHIAKVWRGENSQAGRYREFYQCDIDKVGAVSSESDGEILEVIGKSLIALGLENDFEMHISHRGLLKTLLSLSGLEDKGPEVLRLLDKLSKIGEPKVKEELATMGINAEVVEKLLSFTSVKKSATVLFDDKEYKKLSQMLGGKTEELERLKAIYECLSSDVKKHIVIDFSITRGLDYYTGFVFETFLKSTPNIGSVSSGGRYDNLTGLFSKEVIPGVGGSIGLDRLIAALKDKKQNAFSTCDVYVVYDEGVKQSFEDVAPLREAGYRVDVSTEKQKIKEVYRYVDASHIPYILFIKQDGLVLKTVETRTEEKFSNLCDVKNALSQKREK